MKVYGFNESADEAILLTDVSISFEPEAMREFAKFVAFAASEMERLGPDQYDHMHFRDFPTWQESWPDIQLTKIYAV